MSVNHCAVNLTDLIEAHYAFLYKYAYRLTGGAADAEDLTQQTFLTAQTKLEQLREPEHAKAWLFKILRNIWFKTLRRRKSRPAVSLDGVHEPGEEIPLDVGIEREELQAALDELPEEFREPLVLFYFGDFSYKEIAGQLEIPMGTVMSRLARAKGHLREKLLASEPAAIED